MGAYTESLYTGILNAYVYEDQYSKTDKLILVVSSGYLLIADLTLRPWKIVSHFPLQKSKTSDFSVNSLGWSIACNSSILVLSSLRNRFQLFRLKALPMAATKSILLEYSDNFQYYDEERLTLKIDFVHHRDPNTDVKLWIALSINKNHQIEVVLYEWDCKKPFETISIVGELEITSFGAEIPKFLIPIRPSDGVFLLVGNSKIIMITIYEIIQKMCNTSQISLPDSPVSYFMESFDVTEDNDVRFIYFGTTTNKIYQLEIDLDIGTMNLSLFTHSPIAIGSSLILTSCDQDGNTSREKLLWTEYVLMHTGGNGVIGGSIIIRKEKKLSYQDDTLFNPFSPFQNHGIIYDALYPTNQESLEMPNESLKHIMIASGSSQDSWGIATICYGIKAESSNIQLDIYPGAKIFTNYYMNSMAPYLLIISSPIKTKVYEFDNSSDGVEILDLTDSSTFELNHRTISFGSTQRYNIQVHLKGVNITNLKSDKLVVAINDMEIKKAYIYKNFVVICHESKPAGFGYYVSLYEVLDSRISNEVFNLVGTRLLGTNLDTVSIVKVIQVSSIPYIFIGTNVDTNGHFKMFRFNETMEPILHFNDVMLTIKDVISVNDVLLIGLASGFYISGKIENDKFSIFRTFQIGRHNSVEFLEVENEIIILGDHIHIISRDSCVFKTPTLISTDNNSPITSMCLYPKTDSTCYSILALTESLLTIYDISANQSASIVPQTVTTSTSPRKIIFLSFYNLIAVLHQSSYCNQLKVPFLEFVDPKTSLIVPFYQTSADDWLMSKSQKSKSAEAVFEEANCMMEWTIKIDGGDYPFIVVGTTFSTKGYVYILELVESKETENGKLAIMLKRRYSISIRNGIVLSVCRVPGNIIAVGTPNAIEFYQLIHCDKTQKYKFTLFNSISSIGDPVTDIQVFGDTLSILTQKKSIKMITINENAKPPDISDISDISVNKPLLLRQFFLDKDTLVLTNKRSMVHIFHRGAKDRFEPIFKLKFPTMIMKVVPMSSENNILLRSLTKNGDVKTMVMIGLDGSIFMVILLGTSIYNIIESRASMVRFDEDDNLPQNLISRSASSFWREKESTVNIINGDDLPEFYYQDDFLSRFIDKNLINNY